MRTLLSACLALGWLNQGIARAEEASDRPAGNVTVVPDSAALARSLARMAPGDRILVATDEGAIVAEFVEERDGDLIVDRALIEGGFDRLAIPMSEVRGVSLSAPHAPPRTGKVIAIAAGTVAAVLLSRLLLSGGP